MAEVSAVLRSERRNNVLVMAGLLAASAVAGTVVTNERGMFVPLGLNAVADSARIFAALTRPVQWRPFDWQPERVSPLAPFDVTGVERGPAPITDTLARGDYPDEQIASGAPLTNIADLGNPGAGGLLPLIPLPAPPLVPGPGATVADQPLVGGQVPEPSVWALLLAGFALIGIARRRARAGEARQTV